VLGIASMCIVTWAGGLDRHFRCIRAGSRPPISSTIGKLSVWSDASC
jgi:hypothetical protein